MPVQLAPQRVVLRVRDHPRQTVTAYSLRVAHHLIRDAGPDSHNRQDHQQPDDDPAKPELEEQILHRRRKLLPPHRINGFTQALQRLPHNRAGHHGGLVATIFFNLNLHRSCQLTS
ncbi:hypothetical protein HLH34_19115 [Gluconacetobacter azotocaptans]|uniref:Uncharacterized protein n=1 Tax=Gluconacetobacter azotocaptans TaxID=142834 RepID=A0A7W4JW68_9PROT|nr:hypothetical protein [Gluconacetobacter azotocaptans]